MEKKEEFIRVGTTLYKIVDQPRIDGGYVRKRIAWNSETLRQDYGKDYMAGIPKYDGFCTVRSERRTPFRQCCTWTSIRRTSMPRSYR